MALRAHADDHRQPYHEAERKAHHEDHAIARRPCERAQLLLHNGGDGVAPKHRGEAVESIEQRAEARLADGYRGGLRGYHIEAEAALELSTAEPGGETRPCREKKQC